MDHKEKDNFDVDIQACSTMDCTGLIPSLSQTGLPWTPGISSRYPPPVHPHIRYPDTKASCPRPAMR